MIIAIIVLSIVSLSAQNDTISLTFEQALNQMNSSNLAIKSAEAEKRSNEFMRKTTRGLFLPKITLSASYLKLDEDLGVDISGLTEAYRDAANIPASTMLPNTLIIQQEELASARINLLWPIFTGGKIKAANNAMDANIDNALYKIEQTRNELNTELVQRYYGYRLSLKAVELYSEVYQAMLLHQDNAKKLEENGMISKAQRLYTDIAVSMAKTDLENAKNKSNTVKDALKNTLSDSSEIRAISELFLIKKIEPVSFFQNYAIANNPQLKQVEATKTMAKQNYNLEKSNYLPTIAVVGSKRIAEYQVTDMIPNWFVGVNLRWTIFNGVSRTYKTQAARATMDRVDFIQSKAHADISTYINKLYDELQSYVQQLESMETTYTFAKEYLRVQQKAFSEGFATSRDLVDAQTTINKVKTARIKIMNDYVYTLAKLLEISGKSNMFLDYSRREDREREDFED
jgi:outer membrane protein TolC